MEEILDLGGVVLKICLIRSGPRQGVELLRLLQQRGDVLDACHAQHFRITRIELDRPVSATVRGVPLAKFDRIFFLGIPPIDVDSEHDQSYVYEEAYSATLTALSEFRSRLINAGVLLGTSGSLRSSQRYVNLLARLGWITAGVAYHYDFGAHRVERIVRPPAPDDAKCLLLCTQRSFRLVPELPQLPTTFYENVLATQRWMAAGDIDLIGLSVAMAGEFPVIHGAQVHPEIVFELPELASAIADVLC